jgi:pimeloyl-ACP methyl ester carboxylesterase
MCALGLNTVIFSTHVLMGFAFASSQAPVGVHSNGQPEVLDVMGRATIVYKPAGLQLEKDEKVPAIFVLHGSDETAADFLNKGFNEVAEKKGFLVVYPEMKTPGGSDWDYKSDIPYFKALINRLQENDYRMNSSQAFVCGHSAGGTMSLFLQNEVNLFTAAGAVESAPGHLAYWDMAKPGHATMIIWNHADPVLAQYAPEGDESLYYNLTVSTLRRHGSKMFTIDPLPTSETIISAELKHYPKDTAPVLKMLAFKSHPGTHDWADTSWSTFNATDELVKFFLPTYQGRISGTISSSVTRVPGKLEPEKLKAWFDALRNASMATICLASLLMISFQMCKRRSGIYDTPEFREPLISIV